MCNNFLKIVTWNYGTFGLLNLNKDTSRILQCQVLLLRSSQKHEVLRQSVFVICCCQFLLCNACVVNRHSMILFCGAMSVHPSVYVSLSDDAILWLLLLQMLYLIFVYGIFRPDESYLNSYRYLSSKDSWIAVMLNLCGPRSLSYTLLSVQ